MGLFDGAEVIYAYSRADAIEDGVLVDVTETAKEAGFRWHTAVTRKVWCECVEVPEGLAGSQDERGRLWDVLQVAKVAMRRVAGGDRASFKVSVLVADARHEDKELYIHVGPGDDVTPVLTIMVQGED